MTVLRPIRHEDRLSIVDHLDELRTRIIISGLALAVVFCLCFWQNGPLINSLNRALPKTPPTGLAATQKLDVAIRDVFENVSKSLNAAAQGLAQAQNVPPSVSTNIHGASSALAAGAKQLPKSFPTQEKPLTIGVGESFTTTLTVVGYFAILFTLPLLLYQLYAYVIPALSREERKVALPSMLAAPVLFLAGVVFSYFEVLPPAVHFLQGYNSQHFQIMVQAKSYYRFEIFVMMGIGLAFQVPLLLLALQKVGLITARSLTLNWRYATLVITIIVAALPGVDPVTMIFETLPLVLLYLASIVLLKAVESRAARRAAKTAAAGVDGDLDAA